MVQHEPEPISKILSKSWAVEILSFYNPEEAGKQIFRFSHFKHGLKIKHDKVLNEHLQKLCEIGILRRKEGGYAFSAKYPINYIFKCDDIRLIQECPIDCIFSAVLPYKKGNEKEEYARYFTVYGLETHDSEINEMLFPAFKKLKRYFDVRYKEKFQSLVEAECKEITDDNMIELIRKWHSRLIKKTLLLPMRNRTEIEPIRIHFKVPEEKQEEFKEISNRIWTRFYRECPPIGIMLRF